MDIQPTRIADLRPLAAGSAEAERYEANIAGGGRAVKREAVRRERVAVEARAEGAVGLVCEALAYHGEVEHVEDRPRVVFVDMVPRALGLPQDWRGWARLEAHVVNGPVAMGIELTVFGARSRLLDRRDLAPGERAVLVVDLRDLALSAGIMPLYAPQSIRLAFELAENGPAGTCELVRLALAGKHAHGAVLDRWGQRISAQWPTKVRSDDDLVRARDEESAALEAAKPLAERGVWGGWLGGGRFEATGFFRVERDGLGRWWYVDPEGLAFWSTGPTCIRLGDGTPTAGREEAFEQLPVDGPEWAWAGAAIPRLYAFNVLRKYGSASTWAARVAQRLKAWGPNTIANWSDPIMYGRGVAYTHSLSSHVLPRGGRFGRMPDVFDPAWEAALREALAAQTASMRHDPWLIGYFVDNEMPWGGLPADQIEAYAQRYFETVRSALKAADPNHLYMGCRFVRNMPDRRIVQIAGRHVDVLSVNAYSVVPFKWQFDGWFEAAGGRVPIQIGEHQFALRDPRGLPTPWMAMTAAERRQAVPAFSEAAARLPYCIGTHWFQFGDQPGTGRPSNGENMLIGLVDITDQPYAHMVEAFGQIASNCYDWHGGAGAL
jgi:hypothetical protein